MQRLFTAFPIGLPGAGLLVLRCAIGVSLIILAASATHGILQPGTVILPSAMALSGLFLLVGLWTPLAGVAAMIAELSNVILSKGEGKGHILFAVLCLSIMMLGPGAWSIDARLYGRKRIDF